MNHKIKAILKAAATVMSQKGFEKATMDEIARMSKVAKGTLYYYFQNKENLFLQLTLSIIDELERRGQEIVTAPGTAAERMAWLIRDQVDFFSEYREEVSLILGDFVGSTLPRESFRSRLQDYYSLIGRLIEEGAAAGEFREVDSWTAATALFGMVSVATFHWLLNSPGTDRKKLAEELVNLALRSLAK